MEVREVVAVTISKGARREPWGWAEHQAPRSSVPALGHRAYREAGPGRADRHAPGGRDARHRLKPPARCPGRQRDDRRIPVAPVEPRCEKLPVLRVRADFHAEVLAPARDGLRFEGRREPDPFERCAVPDLGDTI